MEYLFELTKVKIDNLKDFGYDEKIIEYLKARQFEKLGELDMNQYREDRKFMEPLLYAVILER